MVLPLPGLSNRKVRAKTGRIIVVADKFPVYNNLHLQLVENIKWPRIFRYGACSKSSITDRYS